MQHNSDIFGAIPDVNASGRFAAPLPETEEGVYLDELPVGARLDVETAHTTYHLENLGDAKVRIQGHPKYCPEPVVVDLHGSTSGGTMLKMHFIGVGLRMEFQHPAAGIISTSRVVGVREVTPAT